MYPLQIAFSNYALIGLTLFLLASTIAAYLVRLPSKSCATRYLIAFFAAAALSGLATILSNASFYWEQLFLPWQDFWVLAGGVALSQFAYLFPHDERSREATAVLVLMSSIALAAFAYSIYFNVRFLAHSSPSPGVSELFYLLLPTGTFLIVIVFLRRSLYYSTLAHVNTNHAGPARRWRHLIYPQGREATALRNLALALSLAFLPGIQTWAGFPAPYGFVLSNLGSLLAIAAIAFVYLNTSAEINSFMAKLVGITLGAVLLIFSIVGSLDIYHTEQNYWADRMSALATVYDELARTATLITAPSPVAYVASWDTSAPDEPAQYRLLFLRVGGPLESAGFDLNKLIQENREGRLASSWAWSVESLPAQVSGHLWQYVQRFQIYPVGSQPEYEGFIFVENDTAYEIGFSRLESREYVGQVVIAWMALLTGCTALILLLFPIFFRTALVKPLQALLAGINRVNRGDLDTAVPIHFNDEIGFLTRSFNNLSRMLKQSQMRQKELLTELQASHDELETRISDRIRELSAFADLTRLAGGDESVNGTLQPALNRVLETGLCRALCVHLLSEDGEHLHLAAHRYLPESTIEALNSIPLSGPFAARVRNANDFLMDFHLSELPAELQMTELQSYLGAPLDAGGRSHGWMSFYRKTGESFHTSEASLLVALARQIGVIVENNQLRQRIAQIAAVAERQRMARDLHDSATQLLYSLTLFSRASVDALEEGDNARLQTNLEQMEHTSLQALRELRSLLFELQPPLLKELGLMQTLTNRFDKVERRTGIEVDFHALSDPLPQEIERELYFVATEALNNVLKHAAARHVSMAFKQTSKALLMSIVDDGNGFEPDQRMGGLGLENMRQRVASLNGTFAIESAPGDGTEIVVLIPISGPG